MIEKSIRSKGVGFNSPLHELDSESQTYGCRATNPDICANAYLDEVCAFVREDNICVKPSRQWKKQYMKLLEQNE
jgi:hypothetical protein